MSPVLLFLPLILPRQLLLPSSQAPSHFWSLGHFSLWVQFHLSSGLREHHALSPESPQHLHLHRARAHLTLPMGCPKGTSPPVHPQHTERVLSQSSPCIPASPSLLCPRPQGHLRLAVSSLNLHLLSSPRAIHSTTRASPWPLTGPALTQPPSLLTWVTSPAS